MILYQHGIYYHPNYHIALNTPLISFLKKRGSTCASLLDIHQTSYKASLVILSYPLISLILYLKSMILEISFAIYFILLVLLTIYLGVNYCRIGSKTSIHPKTLTFLLPFLINFLLAKSVFYDGLNPFLTTLVPCLAIFFIGRKLQNMRIIGLTGGIATGKSTLVRMMKENLKLQVIDCDKISRQLTNKGRKGYNLIIQMLGEKKQEYINHLSQQINREKFSNFVFNNTEFRKDYTKRIGSYIMWEIFKQIIANIWNKHNLMLIDAPILYETKVLEYICFPVIVVGCSEDVQIQRLMMRNNYSKEEAEARVHSQMPLEKKKKKAQIYIDNCGTEEDLLSSTLTKLTRYIQKK